MSSARRITSVLACTLLLLVATGAFRSQTLRAQSPQAPSTGLAGLSAQGVYEATCANCHAVDGRGSSRVSALLEMPLPDFTDCSFATREPDADWGAVIHAGGPVRGFDPMMPSFGEAMTETDINAALSHVRTFCDDDSWPRGELNLPRALVTEKAYPEDEAVWTTAFTTSDPGAVSNEIVYEKRFGAQNQIEIKVPLEHAQQPNGDWDFGAGDVALGFKRALSHDFDRGYIVSAAGEIVLPTGDESAGIGGGVTIFETFVSYGQILPRDSFFQAQVGLEFPSNTDKAENEAFWRLVAGRTWTQGAQGFGRAWTPMIELLAARELEEGGTTHWDVVPQVQISLNTRQHVLLNVGLRMPMNDRAGRATQLMVYVLWDWFDGGFFDGW